MDASWSKSGKGSYVVVRAKKENGAGCDDITLTELVRQAYTSPPLPAREWADAGDGRLSLEKAGECGN